MHTHADKSTTTDDYNIHDHDLKELEKELTITKDDEASLKILRSISDPTKFKIFLSLCKVHELSVGDLSSLLKLSQSAVSHALADLKILGLVECRRCGQLKCYTLTETSRKIPFHNFLSRLTSPRS